MIFLEGYLLGLGMILFIGPVFFLLLSTSLQLGAKAGIFVALGIIMSDIICVSLCYYGFTSFFSIPQSRYWITFIGGILLISIGLKYVLKTASYIEIENRLPTLHYLNCFVKGFLVNFVNPFVFLVWIGVVSYAKELGEDVFDTQIYLIGVLLAILSTDLLKVFTAKQIKPLLLPAALQYLYKFSGVILIGFGIRMLFLLF